MAPETFGSYIAAWSMFPKVRVPFPILACDKPRYGPGFPPVAVCCEEIELRLGSGVVSPIFTADQSLLLNVLAKIVVAVALVAAAGQVMTPEAGSIVMPDGEVVSE